MAHTIRRTTRVRSTDLEPAAAMLELARDVMAAQSRGVAAVVDITRDGDIVVTSDGESVTYGTGGRNGDVFAPWTPRNVDAIARDRAYRATH